MNAEQSRKIATEVNKRKTEEAYKKIQALIKINVDLGKFETYFYDDLDEVAKKLLEDDGFIITIKQTGINETGYLIKW